MGRVQLLASNDEQPRQCVRRPYLFCLDTDPAVVSLDIPFVTIAQITQGVTELAVTVLPLSNLKMQLQQCLGGMFIKTCGAAIARHMWWCVPGAGKRRRGAGSQQSSACSKQAVQGRVAGRTAGQTSRCRRLRPGRAEGKSSPRKTHPS